MDQNLIERVQLNERIRIYFVYAFVWYFCVSSADIYRSPQSQIKNAALPITLASYRATSSLSL